MRKLYWRPQRLSTRLLLLIALVSMAGLGAVETFRVTERQRFYKEKRSAARLALRAFQAIKAEKKKRKLAIDPETDAAQSGLIGVLLSSVTTNTGHLPAKQTSVNPNFAAAVVDMLMRADVQAQDVVAVGLSGSFPALNICVLAALQTLKLRPVVVSSAGASQWGANLRRFMWPDMERVLYDQRVFYYRSAAVSLGGIDDGALGLSDRGRRAIRKAVQRNKYYFLAVDSYDDSLEKRMALYAKHAGDGEIKAYINVGGGTASVGTKVGRDLFKPGLNRRPPRGPQVDAVIRRFSERGLPVIHLSKISKLAERYGFPQQLSKIPAVGEGKIFVRAAYNRYLTGGALLFIVALLFGFLRLDWGYRLLSAKPREQEAHRPEPMV